MKTFTRSLVEQRVDEMFRRLPLLLGFSLDEDLSLADLEVDGWPGERYGDGVYAQIDDEIAELISELDDAGAAELLRSRTFARSLQ